MSASGSDLHATGTHADHGDSLTGDIDAVIPARALEHQAIEIPYPRNIGIGRNVEQASGTDHHIRPHLILRAILAPDADDPPAVLSQTVEITSSSKRM
nr:hypothetical protein [Acidocella aquatica]